MGMTAEFTFTYNPQAEKDITDKHSDHMQYGEYPCDETIQKTITSSALPLAHRQIIAAQHMCPKAASQEDAQPPFNCHMLEQLAQRQSC